MPFRFIMIILYMLFCLMSTGQSKTGTIDSFYTTRFPGQLNGGLLLAEKGKIVYQKAFGIADFKTGESNTESTKFNLASISKVITSTAVLQLMEKGKINIEVPIKNYLADFPYPAIAQLLVAQLQDRLNAQRAAAYLYHFLIRQRIVSQLKSAHDIH